MSWTKLQEEEYFQLVQLFRDTFGFFNWKIEKYWDPSIDEEKTKADEQ